MPRLTELAHGFSRTSRHSIARQRMINGVLVILLTALIFVAGAMAASWLTVTSGYEKEVDQASKMLDRISKRNNPPPR
jgi:hypothetical protein